MIIFLPNKKILKSYLITLPFLVITGVLVYIAYINNDQILMNIATIFLLMIFLVIMVFTRIFRKDNIILDDISLSYETKEDKINLLNLIFLQYEKKVMILEEIKKVVYDDINKELKIDLNLEVHSLNLKFFTHNDINRLIKELDKRVNNNG